MELDPLDRELAVAYAHHLTVGRASGHLELVRDRDLSVVVFRRLGWTPADYTRWSDRMLAEEFAFVVPTAHDGETLARFAIVNP